MNDKIWTEYELRKRDEIAANASQEIANSKHPRQYLNLCIRDLLKYEIIPNYVFDDWTDDEIRQLATQNLNPPKRLSKAARFEYFNKFPSLSVEQCSMLLIDVEPGAPIRTQAEKDQYDRVINLAASYCRDRREPFANDHVGHIRNYQISPYMFVEWLEVDGEEPPKAWKPIKPIATQKKADTIPLPLKRWREALNAAIEMVRLGKPPNDMQKVVNYMQENSERFRACCDKTINDENLIKSITQRSKQRSPLDDDEYLSSLAQFQQDGPDRSDKNTHSSAKPLLNI